MRYDLIVIGSGPAGEKGAAQAAYFGKRVALVERERDLGGACVNTGTIPSKTLRESALQISGFRKREISRVEVNRSTATVADLMERKKAVLEKQWRMIEQNLRRHDIDLHRGDARFVDAHTISLGDQRTIEGEIILIATGSSPHRPSTVPFDDRQICDSDSILRIEEIPRRLVVVGAGVIGCEYASIFASLGVEVHLIDGRTQLLGHVDQEIVSVLLRTFESQLGVRLHLGDEVDQISRDDTQVTVTLRSGDSIACDTLLYAAGRSSNTATLDLQKAGVETGKRGVINVDGNYRTSVPNIFAAGDVIGFPALASTSAEQGRVAMVHAFDLKYKTEIASILPYGIYTIPELSMVGRTEEECRTEGIDFESGRAYYRNNARGLIVGDPDGMIKLVFEKSTKRLLGVHIVGENASELLHVGMMVMHFGGSIDAFIQSVFNYPTLGEAYKYAAYDGLGNLAKRDRS
jgi:NAD(P) transhydrogenase